MIVHCPYLNTIDNVEWNKELYTAVREFWDDSFLLLLRRKCELSRKIPEKDPVVLQAAPMLRELGYDPTLNPPNYGLPDPEVINNTNNIQVNRSDIQYIIQFLCEAVHAILSFSGSFWLMSFLIYCIINIPKTKKEWQEKDKERKKKE